MGGSHARPKRWCRQPLASPPNSALVRRPSFLVGRRSSRPQDLWASSVAETVKVAVHQALSSYHPDGYVEAIEPLLHKGEYEVVLLAASAQGKDLAPRLAARLDVPLLQDITGLSVDGEGVEVTRPIYAGKALARVRVEASPLFVTLRPNGFPVRGGGEAVPVETISLSLNPDACSRGSCLSDQLPTTFPMSLKRRSWYRVEGE